MRRRMPGCYHPPPSRRHLGVIQAAGVIQRREVIQAGGVIQEHFWAKSHPLLASESDTLVWE